MSGTAPPLLLFAFMVWTATFHVPYQMYSSSNSEPSHQMVVSDQVTPWEWGGGDPGFL